MTDRTPVLPPDVSADDAEILWTDAGRPYVRTPDDCFDDLPGFSYEPRYTEVDGMRMAYVEAGPVDGDVVLCLHGQPTWSYLYRKMIPVLAEGGCRVIAPDLIGLGRSDKPVQLDDYTFLQHVAWVEEFMDALDLRDVTPIVQDWGSMIGLRCVGNDTDRFARVVVANGNLMPIPEGFEPIQLPDSLEPQDLELGAVLDTDGGAGAGMAGFEHWAHYALVGRSFMPSAVMKRAIRAEISGAELAAYDAPYPKRIHMAAIRKFPAVVNTVGHPPTNEAARAALDAFPRPVLGCFGLLDPIFGRPEVLAATREQITGAFGQPHHDYPEAGHFIQEDVGADLAGRVVDWMKST